MSKFAFFGTDKFSVVVLNTLKERGYLPTLIITVPDQPKGRKLILTPPEVKIWAKENKISYLQPTNLKSLLDQTAPKEILIPNRSNFDFFLVASYGKIIPKEILDLPLKGTLNIHPSLLPKYRGATPLESTIISGDQKTGVTIIVLDEQMDHGPILAQKEITLNDWDPFYEELRDKLATEGADLLIEYLSSWLTNKIKPGKQNNSLATFTKKITKEDGLINLDDSDEVNFRKIRAYTPWPGAYFFIKRAEKDFRVIIKKAHLDNGELVIDQVLPEGKKEISWDNFKKDYLHKN